MRLFRSKRTVDLGPYVNITAVPPFGVRLHPGGYDSLARAKANRPPGARTVRYHLAIALLVESARDVQRWDALGEYAKTRAEAMSELTWLRSRSAAQTGPVLAVEDMPASTWDLLARARLALAGLGHVRPRRLPYGYSVTEVEVVMTEIEVQVLSSRLSDLSVPARKVKS